VKLVSRGGSQARAIASSDVRQYHHAAGHTPAALMKTPK
jgi:hypothetical protein